MMVKQTRHIFKVGDIDAVRIQCSSTGCRSEWIVPLGNVNIPLECPSCESRWTPKSNRSTKAEAVLKALAAIVDYPDDHIELRFEIDGEDTP